jgi:hypothetical protein
MSRRNKRLEDVRAVSLSTLRGIQGWALEHPVGEDALAELVAHVVEAYQTQRDIILGTATRRQKASAELQPSRAVVDGLAQILAEEPTAEERP